MAGVNENADGRGRQEMCAGVVLGISGHWALLVVERKSHVEYGVGGHEGQHEIFVADIFVQ